MSWQEIPMNSFLKARTERFKPTDDAIKGLKRIEKIDFSGNVYISDKPSKTDMILVRKGDLVISGINVEKGAMAVYQDDEDITATIHYSSYEYDETKIDLRFLRNFLKSAEFIDALKEQVPGGIKTEIKPKHILPLKVFIPAELKEQVQIVEKLESNNSIINKQSGELINQLDLIKQLRQVFLREAMQGKLTAKWREENPDVEPASELLKKIKHRKEILIKNKKLKRGKSSGQSVSLIESIALPILWSWCKTDDIFFVTKLAGFEYTKYISLKKTGDIPVIRAQNVRPFEIDKTNLLFIDTNTSELLERCALIKESLLVTFIGAGIGDVARFHENNRWHLAPNVAKLEPFEGCESSLNLKFLNYFLMSNIGRKEIFKHIKATAQPSLSMGTIRDIDLPVPPLSEQQQIVTKLDELMQYCDKLEESIKTSQQQNEMLLQQVLREALEPGKK
jgi:type I restriction enzyme, S subunit